MYLKYLSYNMLIFESLKSHFDNIELETNCLNVKRKSTVDHYHLVVIFQGSDKK